MDGNYNCAEEKIQKLLLDSNLDIIALQETYEYPLLEKVFEGYNYVYRNKTAILSRFPIKRINQCKKSEKYSVAQVIFPWEFEPVIVVCVQLNFRKESKRITEMENIIRDISPELNKRKCIILGDFNSVIKQDYSRREWEQVIQVKKDTNQENPVTTLTTNILSYHGWNLIDSRKYANKTTGPKSTCRFNTRIDYIFLNEYCRSKHRILLNEHIVAIPDISDHNLVVTTLAI